MKSVFQSSFDRYFALLLAAVLITLPLSTRNDFILSFTTLVLIWAVFAAGFDLMFGSLGMVSFGHAIFLGVGGYALGISTLTWGWPFFAGVILAMAASSLAAWLVSFFALRVSGIFFALVTLAVSQVMYILADAKLRPLTGGADGLPGVPRPSVGGLDFYDPVVFYAFVAVIFVVVMMGVALLRASPFGRLVQAIRQNEIRCEQLGCNVQGVRRIVFIVSGGLGGLAGALLASLLMYVNPQMLHWTTSGDVIIMTLLGGSGTLFGPLAGVILFEVLKEFLSGMTTYWHGILGLLFILGTILLPRGVLGELQYQFDRRSARQSDQPAQDKLRGALAPKDTP